MTQIVKTDTLGDTIPTISVRITRDHLVRYAEASLDFNAIHLDEEFAKNVGLPDIIAHGMLTMALAGRVITEWVGDPGAVFSYGVRFTRPVVVPDDDEGALVELSGSVSEVTTGDDGCRVARVAVTARFEGRTVLSRAVAEVRLPQK